MFVIAGNQRNKICEAKKRRLYCQLKVGSYVCSYSSHTHKATSVKHRVTSALCRIQISNKSLLIKIVNEIFVEKRYKTAHTMSYFLIIS